MGRLWEGSLSGDRVERRLAAILAADVAGYSRLMGQDEAGTLSRLQAHRRELIDPNIAKHKGRIVKTTGDGMLIEFPSVVEAVSCAAEVQRAMAIRNADVPAERRIEFRVGIHQGDIIVEDGDIFGNGVNLAARLEALAEPGGICVSARVHSDTNGKVDVSFDDLGDQQVKNIARPVHAYALRLGSEAVTAPPLLVLPDKPSLAVLPFQNMSGDPEQEYFADGMVEEIITALSRIRWLFVIARNSSFTYKGRAVDVKQVGRELGVRYVLEGSVRKGGNRVRITAQLIEAETGAHLWADRFDGSMEDVFDLQDQVATSVAGVIEPALQTAESRRSSARPTTDLSAYDLYLRAYEHARLWQREGITQALSSLKEAIARDPQYGPALAQAAFCHVMLWTSGSADDPAASRREGIDLAHRALRTASNDPNVFGKVAYVLGFFGEDISAAITLADRALEINPSYAAGWYYSGWLRLWAGKGDIAIDHFGKASRLSPYEMRARVLIGIGMSQFFARSFDEARATLLQSLQEFPKWAPNYRFLAACCAQMGRLDEARQAIERLSEITSDIVPTATHWRDAAQRALYLSGLRLAAGLPEE